VPQTVEVAQIAELPKLESVIEPPSSREETIVAQIADLAGVDPSVAEISLSDAEGDIRKTITGLLDAMKQQQAREEADRLQAAEWQQQAADAEAAATVKAADIARSNAVKAAATAKWEAAKKEKAAKAKAVVAEAQAAPAPEPAPPTLDQLPTHPPAQNQHTINPQTKKQLRVSVSGKPKTPMPMPPGPAAKARAPAPPRQPKKPPGGKDSGSSAAT
jgi:hypothetical protein